MNTDAVPDELNFIGSHGEDWDPAYVIHLYPMVTVRNLLPYPLRYLLEVDHLRATQYNPKRAGKVLHRINPVQLGKHFICIGLGCVIVAFLMLGAYDFKSD